MKSVCKTCKHYGFYEMITHGPYGYTGKIPCATCINFSFEYDNYEPATKEDVEVKKP
ncbi:MAG: hypothetical protein WCY09_10450 [Candidatus Omnitrophota bacterium]